MYRFKGTGVFQNSRKVDIFNLKYSLFLIALYPSLSILSLPF